MWKLCIFDAEQNRFTFIYLHLMHPMTLRSPKVQSCAIAITEWIQQKAFLLVSSISLTKKSINYYKNCHTLTLKRAKRMKLGCYAMHDARYAFASKVHQVVKHVEVHGVTTWFQPACIKGCFQICCAFHVHRRNEMVWSSSCIVVTTFLHRRPACLQYVHLLHMQLFSNSLLAHWMRSTKAIPPHHFIP